MRRSLGGMGAGKGGGKDGPVGGQGAWSHGSARFAQGGGGGLFTNMT